MLWRNNCACPVNYRFQTLANSLRYHNFYCQNLLFGWRSEASDSLSLRNSELNVRLCVCVWPSWKPFAWSNFNELRTAGFECQIGRGRLWEKSHRTFQNGDYFEYLCRITFANPSHQTEAGKKNCIIFILVVFCIPTTTNWSLKEL